MLHVLCAPDKFRNALSASDAAKAMAAGAHDAGWTASLQPIADGGEGSLEIVRSSCGGTVRFVETIDAMERPIRAPYLVTADGIAVVAAADVIGLEALGTRDRDPESATSRGLATVLNSVVDTDIRHIVTFVGGVASVDGGLGLLAGLGADMRDDVGHPVMGRGRDLYNLAHLDLTRARARFSKVDLVVATDVRSPLYGPDGAACVFGPQKGADAAMVARLDAGLRELAPLLGSAAECPGAGAAGGLGAALMALGARRESGADFVLELVDFAARLDAVDLCVTAEGSVDRSTASGKAVTAVLAACSRASVPCVVLGGTVAADIDELYARDAAAVLAIGRHPQPLSEAIAATGEDLRRTTRAVCTLAGRCGQP